MAKKSARSKGYRKAIEKKPYLTKKDITILCVLLAVIAVGAILLFTYDDGALKVKDGKIVDPGENWLIVNGSTNGRRYYKLGEAGTIDGYAMEPQPFLADDNLNQYNYTPEAEDSAVTGITLSASAYDPARLAEGNAKLVATISGSTVSDVATDKAGDMEYTYYTYTHEYYAEETAEEADATEATEATEAADAPAEEAEAAEEQAPNRFEQAINAYVPAAHNGSIVVTVTASADSADNYLTEEELRATLEQALAAVTLEAGK